MELLTLPMCSVNIIDLRWAKKKEDQGQKTTYNNDQEEEEKFFVSKKKLKYIERSRKEKKEKSVS